MAKLLKLRLGVSEDPTALQPTLNDCLDLMVQQSDLLMTDVVNGLVLASAPTGPRRIAGFQQPGIKRAVEHLSRNLTAVCATYKAELSRVVFSGGGKEQVHTEALRFEDLQLFGDAELDQSIELARAQQEVSLAVDDALPQLDALISTLLGWRTVQPGLNPLRPDSFVRSLQACLAHHVPQAQLRETMIVPAAGQLGVNLRKLYRELADWLLASGIEPAVPLGGRLQKGSGATGASVVDSVAKTLLTLDRLRKLLAGDFDAPQRAEFLHTVPASMGMLQEMKQVDKLVERLEKRPRKAPAPAPAAVADARAGPDSAAAEPPRLGKQLGEEVVRLMFDNLSQDGRLVNAYRHQLKAIEPAVLTLAQNDSRFFSDRNHPARQLLDCMTQRSLGFTNESDEGWHRFLASVEQSVRWLDGKPAEADTFDQLLERLQAHWAADDRAAKQRREEAARALLHVEQRSLLAQKLALDFAAQLEGQEVPEFVAEFLRNSWSQVVAEAQLSCVDGTADPFGYRALVDDLVWSVHKSTLQKRRLRKLAEMIPTLLTKLREGLRRIDYPPELTSHFFDNLVKIHSAWLQMGREMAARAQAEVALAAEAARAAGQQVPDAPASEFAESIFDDAAIWLASHEAAHAGYLAQPPASGAMPLEAAPAAPEPVEAAPPSTAPEPAAAPAPPASGALPVNLGELRIGTWVELLVNGQWLRVQLTWATPHGTLFMFTSAQGTAHSMSRRMLERVRADGAIKVVAERNVVDEALDQVAKVALKNSLDGKTV